MAQAHRRVMEREESLVTFFSALFAPQPPPLFLWKSLCLLQSPIHTVQAAESCGFHLQNTSLIGPLLSVVQALLPSHLSPVSPVPTNLPQAANVISPKCRSDHMGPQNSSPPGSTGKPSVGHLKPFAGYFPTLMLYSPFILCDPGTRALRAVP